MKKIYQTILPLLLTLLLFSCENEIDFNGEQTRSLLVLNSSVGLDSPAQANLSKSRFFLDDGEFEYINNAIICLWKEGVVVDSLVSVSDYGDYQGKYLPQVGETLRITASAPGSGLASVEATSFIPDYPTLLSLDAMDQSEIYSWQTYENETYGFSGRFRFQVSLRFQDPANETNYYQPYAFLRLFYEDREETRDYPLWDMESKDPVFGLNGNNFLDSEESYILNTTFSDELFNGKEYHLSFTCSQYINNYSYFENVRAAELHVELQHVPQSYYLYQKSYTAAQEAEDGLGLFAEPVQTYSNIEGGIGLFTGYSKASQTFPVELPDPEEETIYY